MHPPLGFTGRCKFSYCRDGDTPVVTLRLGGMDVAVRLLDCWAPEQRTAEGKESTIYLSNLLDDAEDDGLQLVCYLQEINDRDGDHVIDIGDVLRSATFDRWPGRLYIDNQDVSDLMVKAGHATRERRPSSR